MNIDPTLFWQAAGVIGAGVVALGRRIFPKFDAANAYIKQCTAAVYAIIICVGWPLLNGQTLPPTNELLVQIIATFTTALSTYAVAKAVKKSKAAKVAKVVKTAAKVKAAAKAVKKVL